MIFFDTETTGLIKPGIEDPSQQPRIIELAAMSIPLRAFRDQGDRLFTYAEQITKLINPGVPLPEIITKITGLRDDDLRMASDFPGIMPDVIGFFLADEDHIFVAHNVPFDLGMLVFELRRCGWEHRFPYCPRQMDTVAVSGGKKLKDWARDLGIQEPQTHRALDDVRMLVRCYAEHCRLGPAA